MRWLRGQPAPAVDGLTGINASLWAGPGFGRKDPRRRRKAATGGRSTLPQRLSRQRRGPQCRRLVRRLWRVPRRQTLSGPGPARANLVILYKGVNFRIDRQKRKSRRECFAAGSISVVKPQIKSGVSSRNAGGARRLTSFVSAQKETNSIPRGCQLLARASTILPVQISVICRTILATRHKNHSSLAFIVPAPWPMRQR